MKIIEDKDNSLLNRREVKVIVGASKNPSFPEAIKMIADQFKVKGELIEAKEIKGKFGRNTFLISAFIYKTKEEKDKSEKKKGSLTTAQDNQGSSNPVKAEDTAGGK